MSKPTLYLMLGYPGAGKTTVAKLIQQLTGATNLWADHIRRERFGIPTYKHSENLELYQHLNNLTSELLAAGNSVIYDTNFNFYKDRERLRAMADKHQARAVVIWLTTPKSLAKQRATENANSQTTRVLGNMPIKEFDRMSHNLQPPRATERVLEIDGTNVNLHRVEQILKQANLI